MARRACLARHSLVAGGDHRHPGNEPNLILIDRRKRSRGWRRLETLGTHKVAKGEDSFFRCHNSIIEEAADLARNPERPPLCDGDRDPVTFGLAQLGSTVADEVRCAPEDALHIRLQVGGIGKSHPRADEIGTAYRIRGKRPARFD